MKQTFFILLTLLVTSIMFSCQESTDIIDPIDDPIDDPKESVLADYFGSNIDLENLHNYENQTVPNYIQEDNTNGNTISNETATLGRALFYDKNLSSDNTVSCASCHQQSKAFGDPDQLSQGVNGLTGRHSMRLVNVRFASEENFFWDERANSLEEQTTMPIRDHAEMGFSGTNGDQDFDDLLVKLSEIEYYDELFTAAYGDNVITESRMQESIAQFLRSIQSFDSKYDIGRSAVNNPNQNFPNFTPEENMGKQLFTQPSQFDGPSGLRIGGGLGCQGCHQGPEFDIRENSDNNGVIAVATDPNDLDLTVTRSPSLRDMFDATGELNGPLMHTGTFTTMDMVIDHYNDLRPNNNNELDPRLRRGGGIQLQITQEERSALIAFLKTLSGNDMYQNEKWSDPFIN